MVVKDPTCIIHQETMDSDDAVTKGINVDFGGKLYCISFWYKQLQGSKINRKGCTLVYVKEERSKDPINNQNRRDMICKKSLKEWY